jgi:hypothetical protein
MTIIHPCPKCKAREAGSSGYCSTCHAENQRAWRARIKGPPTRYYANCFDAIRAAQIEVIGCGQPVGIAWFSGGWSTYLLSQGTKGTPEFICLSRKLPLPLTEDAERILSELLNDALATAAARSSSLEARRIAGL